MNKQQRILLSITAVAAMIAMGSPTLAQQSNKQLIGEVDGSMTKNKILLLPPTSTDFSLKLFTRLANGNKENVVVSPFSAYAALSMALNGTAGTTREQMAT